MKNKASILLISLLVISAFTLILAISIAEVTLSTGEIEMDETESKYAYYLAESCLEEALIRIEADTSFTSTTITMGNDSCTVTYSNNTISITVTESSGFTQTYQATTSLSTNDLINNIDLVDWTAI